MASSRNSDSQSPSNGVKKSVKSPAGKDIHVVMDNVKTTTKKKRPGKKGPTVDELLAAIAKKKLYIDTLETRNSDSLDFHEVAVGSVKSALEAAYRAGLAAAKKER